MSIINVRTKINLIKTEKNHGKSLLINIIAIPQWEQFLFIFQKSTFKMLILLPFESIILLFKM